MEDHRGEQIPREQHEEADDLISPYVTAAPGPAGGPDRNRSKDLDL